MKNLHVVLVGLVYLSCVQQADLTLKADAGTPTRTREGTISVPIKVTVSNQGSLVAENFRIGARMSSGKALPFTVAGEPSAWFPVIAHLGPRESVVVSGSLFLRSAKEEVVEILLTVDECDRWAPSDCSVPESDEANNTVVLSIDIDFALDEVR